MREILFRGKRCDNGEWAEGFMVICDDRYFILSKTKINCLNPEQLKKGEYAFCCFIEVDPKTVGQFTGLTDKNGKKIFEGDIVATRKSGIRTEKRKGYYGYDSDGYPQKLPGYNGFYEYKYTCQIDCYAEVKYDKMNGGFYLKGSDMFVSATCNEVVGNIYDNQELINLNGVHKE